MPTLDARSISNIPARWHCECSLSTKRSALALELLLFPQPILPRCVTTACTYILQKESLTPSGKTFKCGHCGWHGDADFNGANNIALVGLSINQPGGTELSCKLSRTVEYVQQSLFDYFRATENPDRAR